MIGYRDIDALDLMPGDRVKDDFTDYAEVALIDDVPNGVKITWRLANGRTETTTYLDSDRFSLIVDDAPKMYVVCRGCGESFDDLGIAYGHGEDGCGSDGWDVLPESEAM